MIDANVLRHALRAASGLEFADAEAKRQGEASFDLIDSADTTPAISAVAWFEVLRSVADEDQMKALSRYRSRVAVVAADVRVAELAAAIYLKMHKQGAFCPKCWGLVPSHACRGCGNQRSKEPRRNDVMIVATAVCSGIRTLYSWDPGLAVIAQFAKQLAVLEPPPPRPRQMELEPPLTPPPRS